MELELWDGRRMFWELRTKPQEELNDNTSLLDYIMRRLQLIKYKPDDKREVNHTQDHHVSKGIYLAVPLGICTAVNVRVGQGLGAFDPQRAKHTYVTALFSVIGIVFTTAVPVVLMRHRIPYLFTSDKEIIDEAVKLFPMLLVFQFCEGLGLDRHGSTSILEGPCFVDPSFEVLDSILSSSDAGWLFFLAGGVSEAVLLACGRQFLGAITIFIGYYCVGLPLGFFLTFNLEFGIIGMWMGLATGFFLTDCVYTFLAFKTDWKEQSRRALNNVRQYSEGLPNGYKEPNLLPYDCERVGEKQSSTTVRQPDWFKIRLRIGFFIFISLFMLYNLIHRFFFKTLYWTTVCQNETTAKKPSKQNAMEVDDHLLLFYALIVIEGVA
ncbi:hypothetical protein ACTXT7_000221 [Hymenolepis weldensis]